MLCMSPETKYIRRIQLAKNRSVPRLLQAWKKYQHEHKVKSHNETYIESTTC